MFDCILSVYALGRHRWLCTYHTWEIWVCMTWLSVYLSYTIMENLLIVYFPCMILEDIVDCSLTIYEWYKFVGHGWVYTYRWRLWGIFDCILPVYELGRHGWLWNYHIWVICVCRTCFIVNLSDTIMVKLYTSQYIYGTNRSMDQTIRTINPRISDTRRPIKLIEWAPYLGIAGISGFVRRGNRDRFIYDLTF